MAPHLYKASHKTPNDDNANNDEFAQPEQNESWEI
jgi:hypothetical protein